VARPLRIEFPGAVYHITSRGNARQKIFLDEKDYASFLEVLCLAVERFNWQLHAYCLMSNHYHILIETPEGNLSRGMRQINGVYTQQFNRRHTRVGHVFQGRYKAIIVDKDAYLLELCRYVVLNPIRAHIVEKPEEWKWSSYRSTVGNRKGNSCLTTDWILLQFGNERKEAIKRYKGFVRAGVKEDSLLKKVTGQMFLGEDNFIEKLRGFIRGKETLKEIPRVQRYITRPSLEEMFKEKRVKDKTVKDKTVYRAHVTYGYTLKEIAEYLGVHYTTISRAVKRVED
jgi:REP element-mobilizing transposase RayT